ncbi:hypothetical protein PSECIP111951_02077 [Pseudoalteromonas holothuriae]|uniref:Xylose isomerase-like TIM barrel domain-containing protein n=1 Tax=Pseudoalteromonas holothuriae TaxID=2963714 RepID=A0A9W4QRY5_9GAMM|nr:MULTISPECIES: sugar phosphate isomerase/epimerase [unclassified Pseudoalteromonas]CAH9050475.1 hypothetical protein PSECIP111854_00538 [Pseudoalteromonas sp. CIP111854]CAH9059468.1 hypothetical protein PSECIP111951_02077 [Pseudoalteromonas sp. CIP111951]
MIKIKFVLLTTLLFSALCFFCASKSQANTAIPIPIGVQLWSVRDTLKNDFDGTLQALANMGFTGVEFAGHFGNYDNNPSALKKRLTELGLVATSAHIGFDDITSSKAANTFLFYKTLGIEVLIVPWDKRAWDTQKVPELVAQLNEAHQLAKRFDMQIGYHNHEKEFNDYQGETFWDYIAQNTPADFPLQLDVGWVNYAGKSPIDYVKKYAGRTYSTHIKIRTHEGDRLSPIIGENNYPWHRLIQTMQKYGATQWLILEQEEYPKGLSSLQSVARSKANLDNILADKYVNK